MGEIDNAREDGRRGGIDIEGERGGGEERKNGGVGEEK